MQTRPTSRLAKKLASYARRNSLSKTARRYGITDPEGRPSKGLTRLLITGYEPRKPATRIRLGLPPEIHEVKRRTINEHLSQDRIQDMPAPLLRWAIQNREEM